MIRGSFAGGFAIAILAGFVSQAQAAPDCGENTDKKATGKPIPIGAVTTMSGIGSFRKPTTLCAPTSPR